MPENKCPHLNCLVHHPDGVCNCDMARYCKECQKESHQPTQEKEHSIEHLKHKNDSLAFDVSCAECQRIRNECNKVLEAEKEDKNGHLIKEDGSLAKDPRCTDPDCRSQEKEPITQSSWEGLDRWERAFEDGQFRGLAQKHKIFIVAFIKTLLHSKQKEIIGEIEKKMCGSCRNGDVVPCHRCATLRQAGSIFKQVMER